MSKNILNYLLGSRTKVKILKYIYQHPEEIFNSKTIAIKVQESKDDVEAELACLLDIGLILKTKIKQKNEH